MSEAQLEELYAQGRYQEAWWLYSALDAGGEATPQVHVNGACAARYLGHFHSALAVVEKALPVARGDVHGKARFVYATLLCELGRCEAAVPALQWWIDHLPEYPSLASHYLGAVHHNLGLMFRQLERYSESMAHYKAACEQFRTHGQQEYRRQAFHNLAWAACLAGDAKAAAQALREAEPLCRTPDAPWHQKIGRAFLYHVTGDSHHAMRLCQSIIDHPGDDLPLPIRSHAYWLAGRIALSLNQTETARSLAEQALWLGAAIGEGPRCLRDAARLVSQTGLDPQQREVLAQLQRWGAMDPENQGRSG